MSEELLHRTFAAREGYLKQMGTVDDLVLAPLINPSFIGGPTWPSLRQAWRRIRNGPRTIIVSDGLSDPFDDQQELNLGFGLEILGETSDPLTDQAQASWLFDIVYAVSQQAAAHGGVRDLIDELGMVSMEIKPPAKLEHLAGERGNLGLLLGIGFPDLPVEWELPAGKARVITVKVLYPSELAFVVERQDEGRQRLCNLFAGNGTYHVSSIDRAAVV